MHHSSSSTRVATPSRLALAGAFVFLVAAAPASAQATTLHYTGTARNGGFRGDATLAITVLEPASGRVRAAAQFSNGLSGEGDLEGTLRGGTLLLRGPLIAAGTRYAMVIQGTVDAARRIEGTYTLDAADGRGGRQTGTISIAPTPTPAPTSTSARGVAAAPPAATVVEATGGAATIAPRMAEAVQPSRPAETVKKMTDEDFKYWKKPTPGGDRVPLDGFFRAWRVGVSGAVVTREDVVTQTRTTTVSAGALAGRLVIRANGTYEWDGRKGRWRRTGNADYPLELIAADLGKDWGIGWDTRKHGTAGNILLVDGVEWLYAFQSR